MKYGQLEKLLATYLLGLGDDELLLGHRDSEWCGHAPILEEDIAFANLALDEIGHAVQWYSLVAQLSGEDPETFPDRQVYHRKAGEYFNAPLVELPNGDWAFTTLRQYLFDAAELARLEKLSQSRYAPLAETALRIQKEEFYHHRHSLAWVKRLGLGTEESHRRLQNAIDLTWPYLPPLFTPTESEQELVVEGFVPAANQVYSAWSVRVIPVLQGCDLVIPGGVRSNLSRGEHTRHMEILLGEMQSVAREEPEAQW